MLLRSPRHSFPGTSPIHRHRPWLFLFATLAWTWLFWITAVVVAASRAEPGGEDGGGVPLLLYALGGLGPVMTASALVAAGRADETLQAFWRRILDPRLLHPRVWAAVILLAVLPPLVVWLGAWGFREGTPALGAGGYFLIGALAGLLEEPGWRGYAQEGLQRRMPVLGAALVVGVFWAAWHLPLFWLAGTWQHGLGVGTLAFWTFLAGVVVLGAIYAWLYNFAGRVVLAAVVLHAAGNVASEVFSVDGADVLELAVYATLAVLLAVLWRSWMSRPVDPVGPQRQLC